MPHAMTYAEALELLDRALRFGINPTIEGTIELVDELGRPQDTFASVQITGTNGKTSTAWMTAALLRAEGVRTGLFTSPHLQRYPERIEIDGSPVADDVFARGIEAAVAGANRLRGDGSVGTTQGYTEFELLTAAALWLFREHGVEVAVLEVGLGGRWDATSVVSPNVAVITGIGLDHTSILGDTPEAIAADKAAIMKSASAPVLGPGTDGLDAIFLSRCDELGLQPRAVRADADFSPASEELTVRFRIEERPNRPGGDSVVEVDGVHMRYSAVRVAAPSHQAANVATAIAATEAAVGRALDPDRVRVALDGLVLPGRFEVVRAEPPVIVDGSHNPQAAAVLADAIREAFPDSSRRPTLLLGVLADKDAEGIVGALAGCTRTIAVTQPDSPRALPAADLAAVVEKVTGAASPQFASASEGLEELLRAGDDGLVVAGSLVVAADARAWLLDGSETLAF